MNTWTSTGFPSHWSWRAGNNTDAFWSHGRELRSGVIGKWLIANGKASWTAGQEPEIFLRPLGGRHFAASLHAEAPTDSVDAILAATQPLDE